MDLAAVLYGLAAILTAAFACWVVIREFRRRERENCQRELDDLSDEIHTLRQDFVAWRHWAFVVRQLMADHGIEYEEPPQPHHLAPEEVTGESPRWRRRAVRRVRRSDHGDGGGGDEG